jgi:hypothetical protein
MSDEDEIGENEFSNVSYIVILSFYKMKYSYKMQTNSRIQTK